MAAGTEASGECGICYEAYRGAGGARAPQLLPCRHSLCQSCLRKLVCRAAAVAFVSCPFCRMVTLVPELALGGCGATPALGTPRGAQLPPREEEEEEGSGAPAGAHRAPGRSVAMEVACAAHAPVFTVWSGRGGSCPAPQPLLGSQLASRQPGQTQVGQGLQA